MAELLSQINNVCKKNCKFFSRNKSDGFMHDCTKCRFSEICIHSCNYYLNHAGKGTSTSIDRCMYSEEGKCKCDIRDHVLEMDN